MRGFSSLETLVAVAVTVTLAVGLAGFFSQQTGRIKNLERKLRVINLNEAFRLVIKNNELCSCHLDRTKNTASASVLKVDTTLPRSPDISLPSVRSTCNFASSSNIFLAVGQPISAADPQVTVQAITVEDILPTADGNNWRGTLTVTLNDASKMQVFKPLTAGLIFEVDTSSGSANARRISSCPDSLAAGGPVSCPAGFRLYGQPGKSGSFCIEANQRPTARTFHAALEDCVNSKYPGFGDGRLCSLVAFTNACKAGFFTAANSPSVEELGSVVRGKAGGIVEHSKSTRADCDHISYVPFSDNQPFLYRCCL